MAGGVGEALGDGEAEGDGGSEGSGAGLGFEVHPDSDAASMTVATASERAARFPDTCSTPMTITRETPYEPTTATATY
jgi:hypothetical protein